MAKNAPGKAHREGISLFKLSEMFPTEESVVKWFETIQWPTGRCCGHCGSIRTSVIQNQKPMPYRCKDCRSYFSVRTGTALEKSRLPLRKWVYAIYLYVTSLKGVSSMKLHRDLKITQKTAWFMLHRLREAWAGAGFAPLVGPVEVDETYVGGKRKNMSKSKRKKLSGRGSVGKTAIVGVKDRMTKKVIAKVIEQTDKETLHAFIHQHVKPDAIVYTDDHRSYLKLVGFKHETVKHSVGEYVRDQAHTNGIESFWALLKRAHTGTFHNMSKKHLQRYVNEFSGRQFVRDRHTIDQMQSVAAGLTGKQLMYRDLVKS